MKRIGIKEMERRQISALAVTILCFSAAPALAYQFPDSDQRKCYQAVDPYAETPCKGTGQDGAYIINPLSYTDNGNGTVKDNNTGLVWQKAGDGNTYNWYRASGTYEAIYNPESTDVCGSLDLGGTGWRLPSKKELMSIVDDAIPYPGPTINTAYFPNASPSFSWASTSVAGDPGFAWGVGFDGGYVGSRDVSVAIDNDGPSYVRCVRGGQSGSIEHFIDRGNGTVADTNTGLVWQQSNPGAMTWSAALVYCEGLDLGGTSDWRLPNIKELESVSDVTKSNPAIDTAYFPNASTFHHWSSTTDAGNPPNAWVVHFGNGIVYNWNKYKTDARLVRCVRGGQSGLSENSLVPGLAGLNVIANAVDQNARTFTTTAAANWSWQAAVTHDGQDAARSGFIGDAKTSSFQTTGNFGAGTVSFWWKVSSEAAYDLLRFFIDGTIKDEISGGIDWQQKNYSITAGNHTLKWEYSKDITLSQGSDAGWVDQVVLPAALAPNDAGDDNVGTVILSPIPGAVPDTTIPTEPVIESTPSVTPGVSVETGLPATEEQQPAAGDPASARGTTGY